MRIEIRAEQPGDEMTISEVITRAFSVATHASGTEAAIVASLRQANALDMSLLALAGGATAGYLATSPVRISNGAGHWYGLGPVAVAPEWQGREVGTRLVTRALDALRSRAVAGCVVLGDPGYYGRFGFRTDTRLTLPGVPAEYFQVLRFADASGSGTVAYHPAFDAR